MKLSFWNSPQIIFSISDMQLFAVPLFGHQGVTVSSIDCPISSLGNLWEDVKSAQLQ